MIELTSAELDRISAILAGIPKGAETALKQATRRALTAYKTETSKRIPKVYDIKASTVKANSKTSISFEGGGEIGSLKFAGRRLGLYKYNVSPLSPSYVNEFKSIVQGHQRQDTGLAKFSHAFVATMKSGHTGLYERTNKSAYPIEEIMGQAVPELAGNEEIQEASSDRAQEILTRRIEHEINRLLEG